MIELPEDRHILQFSPLEPVSFTYVVFSASITFVILSVSISIISSPFGRKSSPF